MQINNLEIRQAIQKKRLKYFEVAEACGVNQYTFSHWLMRELNPEHKAEILKIIENMKV